MKKEEKLVRFDWAIKTILRDKANYDVLEGFLSSLLKEEIKILTILESESNNEEGKKFNRVDLIVEDSNGRKIVIEIQNQRESDYIERLLWGASKVIVESLNLGSMYKDIVKVISISILYFNLGMGDDYIYYGNTEFKGIHTGNPLIIKQKVTIPGEIEKIKYVQKENVFPEYYLIRVNNFNDNVKEDIDEWVYMFKNSEVKKEFKSKNIDKAKEKLDILKMSKEEKQKYERYVEDLVSEIDIMETAKEEGREEGEKKKAIEIAKNLLDVLDDETISIKTGLIIEEVKGLRDK
jgi:predicted transposase/invertase (TIGR01784 family)